MGWEDQTHDVRADLTSAGQAAEQAASDQTHGQTCPTCGEQAYVCAANHVGGGTWLHCTASSLHNFEVGAPSEVHGG